MDNNRLTAEISLELYVKIGTDQYRIMYNKEVKNETLSDIGTALQRVVYAGLVQAIKEHEVSTAQAKQLDT